VRSLGKYLTEKFAKKSHDVRIQLLCATLYGLFHIFGVGGALAIIMKARKMQQPRRVTKIVRRPPPPPTAPSVTV
jgi:hypothetical protein